MEVVEKFDSFEQINKGQWAKYTKNLNKRSGSWIKMKFIDNANPGFKPLQPQGLRENDISTSSMIYPLTKAKAAYILEQFKASKE